MEYDSPWMEPDGSCLEKEGNIVRRAIVSVGVFMLLAIQVPQTGYAAWVREKTLSLSDVFTTETANPNGTNSYPVDISPEGVVALAAFLATDPQGVDRVSIVKVENVRSASPVFSTIPGSTITTVDPGRGYTGIVFDASGNLYADYDAGTLRINECSMRKLKADFSGLDTAFGTNGIISPVTEGLDRRVTGIDVDPGYSGTLEQVAAVALFSGLTIARNFSDGSAGISVIFYKAGLYETYMRSIAFNPSTGSFYMRAKNDVIFVPRTGDDTIDLDGEVILIAHTTDDPYGLVGEDIEFVPHSPKVANSPQIIFNDTLDNTVLVYSIDGSALYQTITGTENGGEAFTGPELGLAEGEDPATGDHLLLINDYEGKKLYIYTSEIPRSAHAWELYY